MAAIVLGNVESTVPVAVSALVAASTGATALPPAAAVPADEAAAGVAAAKSARAGGAAATGAVASMLEARVVVGRSVSVVLAHCVARPNSAKAALKWKSGFISKIKD